MTTTPDAICERLVRSSHAATLARQHRAGFYELPELVVSGLVHELRQSADLIQQQQADIERLSAEKVALEREIAPLRKLRDDPAWEELRAALGKDAKE